MELFRSSRIPLVNSKKSRDVRLSHVKPEYDGDRVTLHVLEADKGVVCHSGAQEVKKAVLDAHKSSKYAFIFGASLNGSKSESRLQRKHQNPETNETLVSATIDGLMSLYREDLPLAVFAGRFLQVDASSVPASEFEMGRGLGQGWSTRPVLFQGETPRLILQDEIGNQPSFIPNIPGLSFPFRVNIVAHDPFRSEPSDQIDYPDIRGP